MADPCVRGAVSKTRVKPVLNGGPAPRLRGLACGFLMTLSASIHAPAGFAMPLMYGNLRARSPVKVGRWTWWTHEAAVGGRRRNAGQGDDERPAAREPRVDWVRNGMDAKIAARSHEYDAILLDLGLPDMAGEQFLQQLRGLKNNTR